VRLNFQVCLVAAAIIAVGIGIGGWLMLPPPAAELTELLVIAIPENVDFPFDCDFSPDASQISICGRHRNRREPSTWIADIDSNMTTATAKNLDLAGSSYVRCWLADERLLVSDRVDQVTCLDLESGAKTPEIAFVANNDYGGARVTSDAMSITGQRFVFSVSDNPESMKQRLVIGDSLNGAKLSEVIAPCATIAKLTVSQNGVIGIVDYERRCLICRSPKTADSSASPSFRLVDRLLFDNKDTSAPRRGIVAVSPSGKYGTYLAGGQVYVFQIQMVEPQSAASLPGEKASHAQALAKVLVHMEIPDRDNWYPGDDVLWDDNDSVYVFTSSIYRLEFVGRSWKKTGQWKFANPKGLYRQRAICNGRLLAWDAERIAVYDLRNSK